MAEGAINGATATTAGLRRRRRARPNGLPGQGYNGTEPKSKHSTIPTPRGPRFATINLPEKYDDLPFEIRLWLASRLSSEAEHEFLSPGSERPFTWQNLLILLDMLWITVPAWWTWLCANPTICFRLAVFYADRLLYGLLISLGLWSNSKLLGLVEDCLRGRQVEQSQAWRVGITAVVMRVLPKVMKALCYESRVQLHLLLDHAAQGACLEASLSSTMSDVSDPIHGALLLEAGMFCRDLPERFIFLTPLVRPASDLNVHFGSMISSVVEVLSQFLLLISVLRRAEHAFSIANIAIFFLAFTPLINRWLIPQNAPRQFMFMFGPKRMSTRYFQNLGFNYSRRPEIILFSLKDWVIDQWRSAAEAVRKEYKPQPQDVPVISSEVLSASVYVASHIILATSSTTGSLSLGSLTIYQSSADRIVNAIGKLKDTLRSLYLSLFIACSFRIAVIEQPKPEHQEDYEELRDHNSAGMRIETRNLSFTYPGSDKTVLHDINLIVEAGETLAIVGFNGSGKSTLVNLLLGLYDDHKGLVGEHLINGLPPSHYDQKSLYARTSCVFQDYAKYDCSLRDNVGVGDMHRLHEDNTLRTAMERGGATKILDDNGFNTLLSTHPFRDPNDTNDSGTSGNVDHIARGTVRSQRKLPTQVNSDKKKERTTCLSGGQWQRIALSRAFMRADKADLVVFDEPSASLDPVAEAELFERIHSLAVGAEGKRTTTIYVSHRFSTVRRADKIAFMDQGTITEYGTHAELMALEGKYHELFTLQRKGFDED